MLQLCLSLPLVWTKQSKSYQNLNQSHVLRVSLHAQQSYLMNTSGWCTCIGTSGHQTIDLGISNASSNVSQSDQYMFWRTTTQNWQVTCDLRSRKRLLQACGGLIVVELMGQTEPHLHIIKIRDRYGVQQDQIDVFHQSISRFIGLPYSVILLWTHESANAKSCDHEQPSAQPKKR